MMEAISLPTLNEGLFLSRHESMQTCSSRDTVCVLAVWRGNVRGMCVWWAQVKLNLLCSSLRELETTSWPGQTVPLIRADSTLSRPAHELLMST